MRHNYGETGNQFHIYRGLAHYILKLFQTTYNYTTNNEQNLYVSSKGKLSDQRKLYKHSDKC